MRCSARRKHCMRGWFEYKYCLAFKSLQPKQGKQTPIMVTFVQVICFCTTLFGLVGCVQLEDFYPFGAAAGDKELARADDGHSAPLRLEEPFPYYDREESTLYVNTNGLLSFDAPSSQYSQRPFPLVSQDAPLSGETFKVIAPFWGDVDNMDPGSGHIWYRQTTTDVALLSRAKQDIFEHSLLYPDVDLKKFNPSVVVAVTWDHVGYFERHSDKTNTFQCVLVTDGRISFAMLLYAEGEIEWITGDSSGGTNGLGGTPAQAGFNSGDGTRFYSLPLSQSSRLVDIDRLPGNTQEEGVWIFRVDQREIDSGECSNDGSISLLSNRGNVLGGSSIVVTGPCFDDYKQVFCYFEASLGGISPEAIILDSHHVLCVVPQLRLVGRSTFKLLLIPSNDEIIESQERDFFSIPSFQAHQLQVNYLNRNLMFEAESVVELTWMPTDVFFVEEQNAYNIDIALYGLVRQGNAASWTEITQLTMNVSNTGQANVTLPTLQIYQNESAYLAIAFQVQFSPLSLTNRSYDLLSVPAGIWSRESYYSYEGGPSREKCIAWASYVQARVTEQQQINDLPPCPCNVDQAKAPNSGFHRVHHEEFLNPQATVCYYQSTPTKTMAARQCCYDDMGGLIDGAPGGGHSDFISPFSDPHSPHLLQLLHFEIDTVPFLDCCKAEESLCLEYYRFRPSAMSSCQHSKHVPAFVYGDPHFVTLDGHQYTFNGKGEFVLIDTDDKSFTLQGRMIEVTTTAGMSATATVLSTLVAKQIDSDTIQFGISRRGIDILVNGVLVELNIGSEILVWNAVISRFGESKYGVRFSCGVNIEMKRQMDNLSAVVVSLPESFMNCTMGLLGYFNGNQMDDLLPAAGLDPLPLDSNLLAIHEGFGLFWLIPSPEISLFTYHLPESYFDYFDPWFTPSVRITFASQELKEQATVLCDSNEFCLYDVAVTGQLEVGNLTKVTSQRRMELIELSRPIDCNPPCQNGTCVQNNTCNCHAGYSGPTCNIENLMEGCVENPCLNRGTCKKLGADSICQCSSFTSGLNCEQNVPFTYNCTSSLETGRLVVRCSSNKPVEHTICNLDCKTPLPCTLPLQMDLANLGITTGNHKLRITATDVTGLNQTAVVAFYVEPLNFTCKSGLSDQQLMISNCSSNNQVKSVECSLNKNGQAMKKCELPLTQNLSILPAGTYVFNVSATDIYRLHATFVIKYTKEPLKLSLINSSPRIWDGTIITDFYVNREKGQFTVICDLDRQKEKNCTNGYVRYDSVPKGTYILKLTARSENGERDIVRRKLVIGSEGDDYCAAHFINNGVEVYGRSVKVQFHGTRSSISYYMCKLDSNPFVRCRSPYRIEDLEPGEHRIKIAPVCTSPDQRPYRTTTKFDIE